VFFSTWSKILVFFKGNLRLVSLAIFETSSRSTQLTITALALRRGFIFEGFTHYYGTIPSLLLNKLQGEHILPGMGIKHP
jgi:hypothetical protein